MELVAGKLVQVGLNSFLLGSGFIVFKAADDYVRASRAWAAQQPPTLTPAVAELRPNLLTTLKLAAQEGLFTSKIACAGTAAATIVGCMRYDQSDPRLFTMYQDPAACGAGGGAALFAYLNDLPLRNRAAGAAVFGAVCAGAVAYRMRNRPDS